MITEALRASVSAVSRMQARACSNQVTSCGMIGRLFSGMRTAQGCCLVLARIAQAQLESPARQPSPGSSGSGASPQAASTMRVSSSSLADTCRYRDMGAAPSSAATRPIETASAGRELALVESVIHLGHTLGVQVIAQGIETPEQLSAICRMGCELGQGHLLSYALDPAQAGKLAGLK